MAITTAGPRPYEIYLRVPLIESETLTSVRHIDGIDSGLSETERDALDSPETRTALTVLAFTSRLIPFGLLVIFATAVIFFGAMNIPWLIAGFGSGLILLAAGIRAEMLMRERRDRINSLREQFKAHGDLHYVSIALAADLRRVEAVLRIMHRHGDTSLDGQARAAVRQIMRQHDREPEPKQVRIAASEATDAATNEVRAAVKEQQALAAADVARAELAISALEAVVTELDRR